MASITAIINQASSSRLKGGSETGTEGYSTAGGRIHEREQHTSLTETKEEEESDKRITTQRNMDNDRSIDPRTAALVLSLKPSSPTRRAKVAGLPPLSAAPFK